MPKGLEPEKLPEAVKGDGYESSKEGAVDAQAKAPTGTTGNRALAGRSRLSLTMRLMASKPFLLVLVLVLASLFLNQPTKLLN